MTFNSVYSIISTIVDVVCIIACVRIAEKKNRRPWLWGILGFLFSIITLIVLLVKKPSPAPAGNPAAAIR